MNKKKLLALLMALVMTLTLVPVTALADDEPVAKIGEAGYATLQAAFDAVADGQTIVLQKNLTQDDGVKFDRAGVSAKLDLNDNTFTVNLGGDATSNRAILLANGALEVYGGTIDAKGGATHYGDNIPSTEKTKGYGCYGAFRAEAGTTLKLYDLTLHNYRPWGLNVKVLGATAELNNVNIISVCGGGIEVTDDKGGDGTEPGYAKLTNCTFSQSDYRDWCSVPVSVSGASTVDVYSTNYTGEYGAYVFSSGGTINIYSGTWRATSHEVLITSYDGTNYGNNAVINVYGGTFYGPFLSNKANGHEFLNISGGTFDHDPADYVATGFQSIDNGGNTWTVQPEVVYVAEVWNGSTKVANSEIILADFDTKTLNDMTAGQTLKLLGDVTFGADRSVPVWGTAFNVDLNGKTLTTNSGVDKDLSNMGYKAAAICFAADEGKNTISNGKIVTAYGAGVYAAGHEVTLSNLDITAATIAVQPTKEYSSAVRLTSGAKVIIESGTYTAYNGGYALAVSNSGGDVTINGGTFTGDIFFSKNTDSGLTVADKKITINGGTFTGNFVNPNKGTLVINGGVFTAEAKESAQSNATLGEGKIWTNNTDSSTSATYPYTVAQAVAEVNGTQYTTLAAAVAEAQNSDTITLLRNIELTATVEITKNLTINLNGHNITATNARALWVKSGDVNITGSGTISANGEGLDEASSVIRVGDGVANNNAATLTVGENVTVSSTRCYGITAFGKNDGITLTVNGTVSVSGSQAAISGNGSEGLSATTMTINGSVSATQDYAIYHPGKGTLTVTGTVTGKGGIEAKGGIVNITGGTVSATGGEPTYHKENNNGTSTANYALAAVENSNYQGEAKFTISGGAIKGTVAVVKDNTANWHPSISITGGKFSSEPDSSYVADGYKAVKLDATHDAYGYFQVGVATITPSQDSYEDDRVIYHVDTVVNSTDGEYVELESKTNLEITVVGNDTVKTNKDGSGVDKAVLSNIKNDALDKIVTDAIEAAGASIGGGTQSAEIVIQLAKSAPEKETGKVTYEVHPEAVITVGGTEVGTVALSNNQLNGNFSFTLDVSSLGVANGDSVKVTHKHENGSTDLGYLEVKNGKITISNINSFSEFIMEKVNDDPESDTVTLTFNGTSLRRRVRVVNEERTNYVVRSSTDARFEFTWDLPTGYSVVQDESKFEWSKDGVNWTSATVASINGNGANLVIEGIPSWAFNTSIHTRLTLAYTDGSTVKTITLTADTRTVNEVANSLSKSTTAALKWVDYAKYLLGTYNTYTIDAGATNGYTVA